MEKKPTHNDKSSISRGFSDEEYQRFSDQARKSPFGLAYFLMAGVGLDVCETLALQWCNICPYTDQISVLERLEHRKKGFAKVRIRVWYKRRIVTIYPREISEVYRTPPDLRRGYVVKDENGKRITPAQLKKDFFFIIESSGLNGKKPADLEVRFQQIANIRLNHMSDEYKGFVHPNNKGGHQMFVHSNIWCPSK
ncbi:MAG: hypothetical protein WA705_12405 [Candidatus Ozemobacteraceae bacterium]